VHDRLAKARTSRLNVAKPMVNPAQIDEGVAQEDLGLYRAGMLEAFFEVRDCVGVPVVLQQHTTKIQRRKCEAPLIVQLAECIYRLGEQVLTSIRVPYGLDDTEWNQSRCLVPDITKLNAAVGFEPKVGLDEIIRLVVEERRAYAGSNRTLR